MMGPTEALAREALAECIARMAADRSGAFQPQLHLCDQRTIADAIDAAGFDVEDPFRPVVRFLLGLDAPSAPALTGQEALDILTWPPLTGQGTSAPPTAEARDEARAAVTDLIIDAVRALGPRPTCPTAIARYLRRRGLTLTVGLVRVVVGAARRSGRLTVTRAVGVSGVEDAVALAEVG